jgi:hypothetical protein
MGDDPVGGKTTYGPNSPLYIVKVEMCFAVNLLRVRLSANLTDLVFSLVIKPQGYAPIWSVRYATCGF